MFLACHNFDGKHYARVEWPDGKSYLDQEPLLVDAFAVIEDESIIIYTERIEAERKRNRNRRKR